METKSASFAEIINGEKPVLVDFFTTWCGPCKMMPPILKELKQLMGDAITILKIDVDRNRAISTQYGIQSIPTLVIFQKGQVKWRQSGVMQAKQLEGVLRQFL